MKDYIKQREIAYYQAGGEMPQESQEGANPQDQIMQLAQQALQGQDCQAAMQVCQIIMQAMSQQGGGQEQPMEQGASGQMMPAYKKGGFVKGGVSKNGITSESMGIKKSVVPTRKLVKNPGKPASKNGLK
jgi:hypothetical protein